MVGTPTPLKNGGVKVSWDDDIPKTEWKVIKFHDSEPPTRCRKYSKKTLTIFDHITSEGISRH